MSEKDQQTTTVEEEKPVEPERYVPELREYFHNLILERQQKIFSQLGLMTAAVRTPLDEYSVERSTYSLHPGDVGTDQQEREKAFMFASREGKYLKYLDRALRKIKDGSFGYCEDCGKSIQKKRLELVPTTRLCVACKMKEEQRRP